MLCLKKASQYELTLPVTDGCYYMTVAGHQETIVNHYPKVRKRKALII